MHVILLLQFCAEVLGDFLSLQHRTTLSVPGGFQEGRGVLLQTRDAMSARVNYSTLDPCTGSVMTLSDPAHPGWESTQVWDFSSSAKTTKTVNKKNHLNTSCLTLQCVCFFYALIFFQSIIA